MKLVPSASQIDLLIKDRRRENIPSAATMIDWINIYDWRYALTGTGVNIIVLITLIGYYINVIAILICLQVN